MINLAHYQGIGQFGRAYRVMLENDTHAPGSVDRALVERMIRLCPETAAYLYGEYTPTQVKYQKGSRPELEGYVEEAVANPSLGEERVVGIARFCSDLGKAVGDDLDAMRVGGTEEEIIRRGSDWCTDVARVGCVLCQVAGLPARLVMLANTEQAYSGHVIIEAYRSGVWGAVDVTNNAVYRFPTGKPASMWELMNHPLMIPSHWQGAPAPGAEVEQFRRAAMVNYFVWEWENYDYTVSSVNAYCRPILEMSIRGWPGGLRWLYDEDKP
ncbi:hypothetical protein HYR99_23700 [Candidatus Poribacteria bacterium]|nr:hypothetical protein [Candidatus Poribacteria bacterium]